MSIRSKFRDIRNKLNSRRNKKLAKSKGVEPIEGDASNIDTNGNWCPLFVPEQEPKDAKRICTACDKNPCEGDACICNECLEEAFQDELEWEYYCARADEELDEEHYN